MRFPDETHHYKRNEEHDTLFFLFLTVIFHHHCHYCYFVWDQNLCLCFSSSISDSNNRSELNDEQHHSQIRRILYPRIKKPSTECTGVWSLERYGEAFYELPRLLWAGPEKLDDTSHKKCFF